MNYSLNQFTKGLVNLMFSVVSVILGMRFVLKLFGANGGNDFTHWVYETSAEILGPFRNIFPAQNLDGFVIEFSTIFALLAYAIVAMLAYYLIDLLTAPVQTTRKR